MSLTNQQYDKLMLKYDERRLQAKYTLDSHMEEVCKAVPAIRELSDRIAEEAVNSGKAALSGNPDALLGLSDRIHFLDTQRRELLCKAGYPADYLDIKYICDKCKDTGLVDNRPCTCFKAARTRLLFEESNLNDIITRENFDTLRLDVYSDRPEDCDPSTGLTPYGNMVNVVKRLKNFVGNFDFDFNNLLIYGNTGLGKTFLCNSIAGSVLDSGHYVLYFTTCSLFSMLEKYTFRYDEYMKDGDCRHDSLFTCDLLIIDDLGTEITNAFIISQLYDIINERILGRRPTIISTNLTLAQLNDRYSERIFSRISKEYDFIKLFGTDLRKLGNI